jgi:hypothetical protein
MRMRTAAVLFVLTATTTISHLHAACKDGTVTTCSIGGKTGRRECVGGRFTPCLVDPDPVPTETGTVAPKFYILSVIYSPPGTQNGSSSSSVAYGSGSTAGTTTASSKSFKQNYKVTATASGGVLSSVEIGANFAYGRNATDNSSLDIKKSANTEITVRGPGIDGIDHDRDQIWLWLSPKVRVTVTPKEGSWTIQEGQTADIQFVFVGHLKNPALMPPGVAQRLRAHGITPADYPEILKANPFANGAARINTARFVSLHTTFPYEPPFAQGDPPTTFKAVLETVTTTSTSSTVQNDYTVGVTVSGSANFLSLFKASVKSDNSWTWTNANTRSASTAVKESASVTVGGPSFGYTGPTDIAVYYDTLFKTFLFAPITDSIVLEGVLTSRSGAPVANREVVVTAGGQRFRTWTNARGEYRVREKMKGPARIRVGNITRVAPVGARRLDLQVR